MEDIKRMDIYGYIYIMNVKSARVVSVNVQVPSDRMMMMMCLFTGMSKSTKHQINMNDRQPLSPLVLPMYQVNSASRQEEVFAADSAGSFYGVESKGFGVELFFRVYPLPGHEFCR
jgi:hypothetical protein